MQHMMLSERLPELLRLRIAVHNQCRSCMAMRYADAVADGVTEDLVGSLERPEEAADLKAAERLALRYAGLFPGRRPCSRDALGP
jgi:AhpD family alkylhydroperoxidase